DRTVTGVQTCALPILLATFGLLLFFNEAVRMIWGDAPLFLSIPPALDGTVPIAPGVAYSAYRLTITLLGLVAAAAMAYLIVRTRSEERRVGKEGSCGW